MFLSCLLIDTGSILTAPVPAGAGCAIFITFTSAFAWRFPPNSRKSDDTDFLNPSIPDDFMDKFMSNAPRTPVFSSASTRSPPGGP